MYTPSLEDFLKLAKTYNVIPVYKEISADLDTPVSFFLKMSKDDYAFLLESVEGQEHIARYSFLGSHPCLIFKSKGRSIEIIRQGHEECPVRSLGSTKSKAISFRASGDPLDEIKKIMQDFKPAAIKGLPRFFGGFVGYMGYDTVRFFERIPDKNPDALHIPDSVFMLTRTILVCDHVNHTIKIIFNVILPQNGRPLSRARLVRIYRDAVQRIEAIHNDFKRGLIERKGPSKQKAPILVRSNVTRAEFSAMVNKAKKYIRDGDIIQVVLSQRFETMIHSEPFDIYRTLRSLNPSPYMFYLKLKEVTLIGSSPEMLVRCEDKLVETRPIAGTRKRGATEKEDSKLQRELLKDSKERAEHLMLVDLGRNDLGRVCGLGKVKVNEFMKVERYSHVMHLVSDVSGALGKGFDVYDVLRACFPAGTVSGSPKVRAMEIIDELENTQRGPYAGCVGYFSFAKDMDTCITIRTIVLKDKKAYIQAGAGIVADSKPNKEYAESVNKARALLEAIS